MSNTFHFLIKINILFFNQMQFLSASQLAEVLVP